MGGEGWGPWIEHDGKGCPVWGQVVQVLERRSTGYEETFVCVAGAAGGYSWDWKWSKIPTPNGKRATRIMKYRIKKPKGLIILEGLLQNLPAPTKEEEKV